MSLSGGRPAVTRVAETAFELGRRAASGLSGGAAAGDDSPGDDSAACDTSRGTRMPSSMPGVILRGELTVVSDNGRSGLSAPARVSWSWSARSITAKTAATGETEMVMFYAGTEGVPLSESADL